MAKQQSNKTSLYSRYQTFRAKSLAHGYDGDKEELEAQIFEQFVQAQINKNEQNKKTT